MSLIHIRREFFFWNKVWRDGCHDARLLDVPQDSSRQVHGLHITSITSTWHKLIEFISEHLTLIIFFVYANAWPSVHDKIFMTTFWPFLEWWISSFHEAAVIIFLIIFIAIHLCHRTLSHELDLTHFSLACFVSTMINNFNLVKIFQRFSNATFN